MELIILLILILAFCVFDARYYTGGPSRGDEETMRYRRRVARQTGRTYRDPNYTEYKPNLNGRHLPSDLQYTLACKTYGQYNKKADKARKAGLIFETPDDLAKVYLPYLNSCIANGGRLKPEDIKRYNNIILDKKH